MTNFPSKEIVERIREHFPAGTRVELMKMDDLQAPPIGTCGTVQGVDDIGSIMVVWDNGSSLAVAYGEDSCRKIRSGMSDTVKEQILTVRGTGLTNMFDVPAVQRIAYERDLYDLVLFLEEHKQEYVHFILTGECK